jgi:SAM-dependent methyltransferase
LTEQPCEACEHFGPTVVLHAGRDYLLGDREERFRALRCANCGFAFLESPPRDLARYYPARYFSALGETSPYLGWIRNAIANREARWLRRRVPEAPSILEVGPGRGDFLLALRESYLGSALRGFDITAEGGLVVDPDIPVSYAATLEGARFRDGEFDLIIMRHVLEHVPHLAGFLREIRRVCRPAGALYVKVPNRSSWAARLFGRYWNGLDFPRHLRYFSTSDLTTVLEQSGFRVLRAGHETDAIDWVGSLRFLAADRLHIPVRGGRAWALIFLGIRVLVLPLALLAQLRRRSSRIWMLARKEGV